MCWWDPLHTVEVKAEKFQLGLKRLLPPSWLFYLYLSPLVLGEASCLVDSRMANFSSFFGIEGFPGCGDFGAKTKKQTGIMGQMCTLAVRSPIKRAITEEQRLSRAVNNCESELGDGSCPVNFLDDQSPHHLHTPLLETGSWDHPAIGSHYWVPNP